MRGGRVRREEERENEREREGGMGSWMGRDE